MKHLQQPEPACRASAPDHRLERWHRWSLYGVCACLLFSGALFLLGPRLWPAASPFGEPSQPFKIWSMKLHGAAAMIFLFLVGSLLQGHIRRALRSRRNLLSGWSMLLTNLVLVVTGYGLYYLSGEAVRQACSTLHWVLGCGLAAVFLVHVEIGKRSIQG